MKTHVTIKGKEISLVSEDAYTSRFTVNELLLALDESEVEVYEKCPCGGVNGKNHPHAGTNFKEGSGKCIRCGRSFDETPEQKPFSVENPPARGEEFWSVYPNMKCTLIAQHFNYYNHDDNVYFLRQNNCFRTREEAEAALARVLIALKG